MIADKEAREDVYRRLRAVVAEFGKNAQGMILVSAFDDESFSDVLNVCAPTVSIPTLAKVDWEVARYFEDV